MLACLDPCHDPPFSRIGPHLFDKLAQLTTVVAVLQDWDDERQDFLRKVRAQGTSVRAFVVREGAPTRPLPVDDELGEVTTMSPSRIRETIESGGAMSIVSEGASVGAVSG